MDYQMEIINIISSIDDVNALAFLYGLIDELAKRIEELKSR